MGKKDNVIKFHKKNTGLIAFIFVLCVIVFLMILNSFRIEEMSVEGNIHYTDKEIKEFVKEDGYVDNALILMLKKKLKPMAEHPFIAKMQIEYVGNHKINIVVYEKAIAGCMEYMDRYVYFDQDGYVLEISLENLDDITCIDGMSFESVELHEKLPIEDKKRFKMILKLTQLIKKYNVPIDSVKFTDQNDIMLYHDKIKVELGDGSKIEEQLIDLASMLEQLEGKEGTLDLKEYDIAYGTASFRLAKKDKKQNTSENDKDNQEGSSEATTEPNTEAVTEATTQAPVTEATTQAPVTEATTQAPVTEATTQAPVTEAPVPPQE